MKTKEKLLKIYSSYLPYELKFENELQTYQLTEIDTINIEYNIWACNRWDEEKLQHLPSINVKDNSLGKGFKLDEIKPILYSMDYLTKEIEHKGERFIAGLMLVDPDREEWDKMICETYKPFPQLPTEYIRVMHESLGVIISINPNNVGHLSYNIFIKLLEMNFNVFDLSDSEYIKKETLNK